MNRIYVCMLMLSTIPSFSNAMMDGIYCGQHNCYDVLGVTRETSKSEIAKKYRQLAKKHHPDKFRTPDAKAEAEEIFKSIATAYEVLKDDESRIDYDYMLDHPEEYYRNYYHYYRRKMSPKVDVRIVIAVSITLISAFQYYTASFRWSSGISYLALQPKYRKMALEVAESEGMLTDLKKGKRKNKEEIKAEEEKIIRTVLEDKMEIRGGYARPKVTDILWVRIILLPKTIYNYISWYIMWIYRFRIKKEEYGLPEKYYLIRKFLGISESRFESIPEEDLDEYIDLELWKHENFLTWKRNKDEDDKRQLAESAKYKAYRRYMKKHGTGRMYFDDS